MRHTHSLAFALTAQADISLCCGDIAGAAAAAAELLPLATAEGFSHYVPLATMVEGWAIARAGQMDEGIRRFHEGLSAYRDVGARTLLAYWLEIVADLCRRAGRPVEAFGLLAEAERHCAETGEGYSSARLPATNGELLLALPEADRAEAERCFRAAIALARAQGAASRELRAAIPLARLLHDQRRSKEAWDILAPVYGRFHEGLQTADPVAAKALLDELQEVVSVTP